MNRFFVTKDQIIGSNIQVLGKDVKHIKDVLRLGPKDKIELVCQGESYICQIREIKSDRVLVDILDRYKGRNEPPIHIILYQGIAKGDKMDLIIQKGTEIGIKEIYPVITNRTVVKIKDRKKEEKKIIRWNTIAEEAAKQSKRDLIPAVHNIISFQEMLDILKKEKNIIVAYEKAKFKGLKEVLKAIDGQKIHIIIGPEGGFEEEEIKELEGIGGQVVTLGPRIFRTETAGIVVASIALYELGDLGVIL
ncbi:MAG: 16S rRNA (uracil(1498)-N(3))-methyltransferase [Tissierellia bacterium]|nr:16S rRNA (uracil(1498)-N(3))-methyltransferase [Tissierellia bacterium]